MSYAITDKVHLATGAEWRDEQFRTSQGDRDGWPWGYSGAYYYVRVGYGWGN